MYTGINQFLNEQDIYVKLYSIEQSYLKSLISTGKLFDYDNPYHSKLVQFLNEEETDVIQKLFRINATTHSKKFEYIIYKLNDKSILYKELYTTSSNYSVYPEINRHCSIFHQILNKAPHLIKNLKKQDGYFYHHLTRDIFFDSLNQFITNSKKQGIDFQTLETQLKTIKTHIDYNQIHNRSFDQEYQNDKLDQSEVLINVVHFVQSSQELKQNQIQNGNIDQFNQSQKMNQEQYKQFKQLISQVVVFLDLINPSNIYYTLNQYLSTEQFKDLISELDGKVKKHRVYPVVYEL